MKYESYHTEISQKILFLSDDKGEHGENTVNKSHVFRLLTEEYKEVLKNDFDLIHFSLTVNFLLLKLQGEGKIKISDAPIQERAEKKETPVFIEETPRPEVIHEEKEEPPVPIEEPTHPEVIPEEKEIPETVNDGKNPSRTPEEYSKTFKIFSCLFETMLIIAIVVIVSFLLIVYFIE